jgi:hypothetical protein
VNQDNGFLAAQQRRDAVLEIVKRVAVLGEENELLVWRGPGRRDLVRTVGRGPCRPFDLAAGDGENLAQQARQLTPFGIRTAVAYVER